MEVSGNGTEATASLSQVKKTAPKRRILGKQTQEQAAKRSRSTSERLEDLLQRWGPSRTEQVQQLAALLGDGVRHLPTSAAAHVWGPPGAGKTDIVTDFLKSFGFKFVRINCASVDALSDLHHRLVEEIYSLLGERAPTESARNLRAITKLEAALRPPLQRLGKVVVVLDSVQYLRTDLEIVSSLPQVLNKEESLTVLTVGHLPHSSQTKSTKTIAEVHFPQYSIKEAEEILVRLLAEEAKLLNSNANVPALVSAGLIKMAVPAVGVNLQTLLPVGYELLDRWPNVADQPGELVETLGKLIEEALQRQLGMLLPEDAEANIIKQLSKAEVRLVLSAYLGGMISKEDDLQLFFCEGQKRSRRGLRHPKPKKRSDIRPLTARPPQPVQLTRLLAIYHRLARQAQLISDTLMEELLALNEMGLLHFEVEKSFHPDKEPRVECHAQLPLIRACAKECKIDLAEYLCEDAL